MSAFNPSPEWVQSYMSRFQKGNIPQVEGPILNPAPLPTEDRYRNKWEREYAGRLDQRKYLKEIRDYQYENVGFRLADKCFFYPDFFIAMSTHFEVHDVKGFMRDDALVKLKIAKDMYPWFRWVIVKKVKGEWEEKEI
jgi:hypothetical protein